MNPTLNVIALLLFATLLFQTTITYMADNISDFENVALPPKKVETYKTSNPILKIDATSRDDWTLVNLTTGDTHKIDDPEKNKERLNDFKWDLGFSRTKIITNSGITNPMGKAGVINLGPVDINFVTEAPPTGYIQDATSWGNVTNKAIGDWYNYRTRTHNIESKKNVYIVRTSEGQYIKMKILNYYCKRKEAECANFMCPRQDAACLTIEYVSPSDRSRFFPTPGQSLLTDQVALN